MYPVVQSKHTYFQIHLYTSNKLSWHFFTLDLIFSDPALISFDPAVYHDITYIDNTVYAFMP